MATVGVKVLNRRRRIDLLIIWRVAGGMGKSTRWACAT